MNEKDFNDLTDEFLEHYGTPRHSGRYPYGSGENPQRNKHFLTRVEELEKQGLSGTEIAKLLKVYDHKGKPSASRLVAAKSVAKNQIKKDNIAEAIKLKEKGYSNTAIAEKMGLGKTGESTIRGWLNEAFQEKQDVIDKTAGILKGAVKDKTLIDIGPGAADSINITDTKLDTAVYALEQEGYKVFTPKLAQPGNHGQMTTYTILAAPGTTYSDVMKMLKEDQSGSLHTITEHIEKNKETGEIKVYKQEDPVKIDPKRVMIRYDEDGGSLKDGTIELRPGVEDLSLGNAHYAQVRIGVDFGEKGSYAKGMAIQGDPKDFPDGVDVIVNSNKSREKGMEKALKPMYYDSGKNKDIDEPFSSSTVQKHYIGKDGKEHLSAINVIGTNDEDMHVEGHWDSWTKSISAQLLSKQDPKVAKKQLDITLKRYEDEYDQIQKINNPIVKKAKLEEFASLCDSDAVHLKAASFPRQASKVILPFPDMKETEIYAPTYNQGEQVALIRYPHAGTFEIPTLTVNNNVKSAKKAIYNAADAVGINPKVARILSGADFDGDSVTVIPLKNLNLKTRKTREKEGNLPKELKDIQDFNPDIYKLPDSAPNMKSRTKQKLMGVASNLITDMHIGGATAAELARATKYSMVIIDAEKHHLDYKQAEKDFNIDQLRRDYQVKEDGKYGGAASLISRANSEDTVAQRKTWYLSKTSIDSEGNKIFKETGDANVMMREKYTDPKTGKTKYTKWRYKNYNDEVTDDTELKVIGKTSKSTKMAEATDARTLMSGSNHEGTTIEKIYANHANKLKELARKTRLESVSIPTTQRNPSATEAYKAEVESLKGKLRLAKMESSKERKAVVMANAIINAKIQGNDDLSKDDRKKIETKAMQQARNVVYNGEKRYRINITPKEWEAIQAGAFTNNTLKSIINAADSEQVTKYSMPRETVKLSNSRISYIKAMSNAGYSVAEIAKEIDVSASTISKYLNE